MPRKGRGVKRIGCLERLQDDLLTHRATRWIHQAVLRGQERLMDLESNDKVIQLLSCLTMSTMAAVAEREATLHEKAVHEDPNQKLKEKAISELHKLGFAGSQIVDAAIIFAKALDQMQMMMALPDILRREYVLKMLNNEAKENRRD